MQLKNLKFENLKENLTTVTILPYSNIINGELNVKRISYFKFYVKLGVFKYQNLSLNGPFQTKLILAIYVDIFMNTNTTYIIANGKNERIENNTYYLYIPTTISSNCGEGQYYHSSKYFSIFV